MIVSLLFHTSAREKRIVAEDVYTKGGLLCVQLPGGVILKYPLCNVFQVAHLHGPHAGSQRSPRPADEGGHDD